MKDQIAVLPSIRRSVGRWIMAGTLALAITVLEHRALAL